MIRESATGAESESESGAATGAEAKAETGGPVMRQRQESRHQNLTIIAGSSNLPLARRISEHLAVPLAKISVQRFADREVFVRINESVRGHDVFFLQSTSTPANDHLIESFLTLDALRRASPERITVVNPYYGYARQDRKNEPRVPISARLMADLFEAAGADRMLFMDLHSNQIQGFFKIPVDQLYAAKIFIQHVETKNYGPCVAVSPDTGGTQRARFMAQHLHCGLAIVDKRRPAPNVSEAMHVIGEVRDKVCIIFDDIIDTGGTIIDAARALRQEGASKVLACASHGVFSGDAPKRLQESLIDEVLCTDSIYLPEERIFPKLRICSVSELVAIAIDRIHRGASISSLFV